MDICRGCRCRFSPASTLRVRLHPCASGFEAQAEDGEQAVFCDRFTLRAILLAQAMTARLSNKDRKYWRAWMKHHAAHTVDLVADDSDPIPGIIHALSEIYLGLRAFPRFIRSTSRASASTRRVSTTVLP